MFQSQNLVPMEGSPPSRLCRYVGCLRPIVLASYSQEKNGSAAAIKSVLAGVIVGIFLKPKDRVGFSIVNFYQPCQSSQMIEYVRLPFAVQVCFKATVQRP